MLASVKACELELKMSCRTWHTHFLIPVDDRSCLTLQPIVENHILPEGRVMSDGWTAYNDLATFDGGGVYDHDVVIHN